MKNNMRCIFEQLGGSTVFSSAKRFSFLLLTLFLSTSLAFAQNVTVKGIVTDDFGDPLIGASVSEKGTINGVMTNVDGNYTLSIPGNATLVISYVGFNVQEIPVNGKTTIDVRMVENSKLLDEVVVVGYGVQKKKLVTGATVQVKGDDVQKLNTVNVLGALQSQTPGVNIVQSSGMPGEGFKVAIRGLGTTGNSAPLYVIDGVVGGDINTLSPSDIESIDVLKDAASAAIYGSRAANGVILVTTKQGVSQKNQITYDGYIGFQNILKMPGTLNAQDYITMLNEQRFTSGLAEYDFEGGLPAELYQSIQNGSWNGTNWMKESRNKNAVTQSHAIGLTGGTDLSKFSIGFSYLSQEGVLGKPTTPEYERYVARINSEHVFLKANGFDVIKIGENLTYTYRENTGQIGIGDRDWGDVRNLVKANPLLPMYNERGKYYDQKSKVDDGWSLDARAFNPIALMEYRRGMNKNKRHNLRTNVYLEIQPIKALKLRSSFAYAMSASTYRSYQVPYNLSSSQSSNDDGLSQSAGSGHEWKWENTISYAHKVGDHTLDYVIGNSLEKYGLGEGLEGRGKNSQFPSSWEHAWLQNAGLMQHLSGAPWEKSAIASFFGRANYNYKEKYMATLILRADGSSNFARGNRWGYFPSVSAGWLVTNENFMDGSKAWLDFFKIRASWGQNGNQSIPPFRYLGGISMGLNGKSFYSFGQDKNNISLGSYPAYMANPKLKWETSEQLDFGFDAYFLNSRLAVNFDWYNKKTKDWLINPPVLDSYGKSAPYANGGDVENKGVEIGIGWNDKVRDFTYGANVNMSYNKNKVTKLANAEGLLWPSITDILFTHSNYNYRMEVGQPMGYFYGFKTGGVFQTQEQINQHGKDNNMDMKGITPGDLIFVDMNGDGVINDDDKTKIGNPHPDVTMGFSFNAGYKGFDFSMTATAAFGMQVMKSYRGWSSEDFDNFTSDVFGRWHGEGTSNRLPRLTVGSHPNWQRVSDIYVENADYLKMQNITIGYDFKKLFPNMPLGQARLYFTAQNLFTITGYSGMDPEVGYAPDSWGSGIDLGFYPSARTYMIGANVKF